MNAPRPISVCFHRRDGYGLFDPNSKVPFGGAEVRSVTFARELARRPGFQVSFMVRDEGQPTAQRFGDVTVLTERYSGIEPFFSRVYADYVKGRSARPSRLRPELLWQVPVLAAHKFVVNPLVRLAHRRPYRPRPRDIYRDAKADVFCCFGANRTAADLIATGRRHGFKVIVFLISTPEVDHPHRPGDGLVPSLGTTGHVVWHALTHADAVVAQTEHQADLLARHFARPATVIRNPIDLGPALAGGRQGYVFWVGRTEPSGEASKRPRLLLELARRCPEVSFRAVINPILRSEYDHLLATKPPNLEVTERIPFTDIDAVYADALSLLNTSSFEGFPNTFLQAAKHGVPVVSLTVDPDCVLVRHKMGVVCADDLDLAASEIRRMWADRQYAATLGQAGRRYVERFHDLTTAGDVLVSTLRNLAGQTA